MQPLVRTDALTGDRFSVRSALHGFRSAPFAASQWPRVTIVTPSFNQAAYLEETMCSVLDQRYPNLEYIIMDGGSTDDSVDIIRRYQSHLAYWESGPDRGQSDAINKGWKRATGDILGYLNSDDLYCPQAIQRAVHALQQRPDAGFVYGFAHVVDEVGRLLYQMRPGELDVGQMLQQNQLPQPAVFFRRRLLDRFGLFDESLHFYLEYEYWLRAIDSERFIRLPRFLATMRLHDDCKSAKDSESFYAEQVVVMDRVFSRPGPWTHNPAMQRSAYLPALLYGAGRNSVFSPQQRSDAITRLRAMPPLPTDEEIINVIAFHDSDRDAKYLPPLGGSGTDSCDILAALESAGLVNHVQAHRVRKTVQALAIARLSTHLTDPARARLRNLLASVAYDPRVLKARPWWAYASKSSTPGMWAVKQFRFFRDRVIVPARHKIRGTHLEGDA